MVMVVRIEGSHSALVAPVGGAGRAVCAQGSRGHATRGRVGCARTMRARRPAAVVNHL